MSESLPRTCVTAWRRQLARPPLAWQATAAGGLALLHADGSDELIAPAGETLQRLEGLHADVAEGAARAVPRPGGGWIVASGERMIAVDEEGHERWRRTLSSLPALASGRSRLAFAVAWEPVRVLDARGQELLSVEGGPVLPKLAFTGPGDALLVAAASGHLQLESPQRDGFHRLPLHAAVVSAAGSSAELAVVATREFGAVLIDSACRELGVVDPKEPLEGAWLSADGTWLLMVASGGALHLVRLPMGDRVWTSTRDEPILCAAIDATSLLLIGRDGTIEKLLHEEDRSRRVAGANLLGGRLAAIDRDLTALVELPLAPTNISVSPEGQRIAVSDNDDGRVVLLNRDGQDLRVLSGFHAPTRLMFPPGGKALVVVGPHGLTVVELVGQERRWELRGQFNAVAVAEDRLVASRAGSRPRLAEARRNLGVTESDLAGGPVVSLTLPREGEEIAALGVDGAMRLLRAGRVLWSVTAGPDCVAAFDGAGLLLGESSGWTRRLLLEDGSQHQEWHLPSCTELFQLGDQLVARCGPFDVRILGEDSDKPTTWLTRLDAPVWPFAGPDGPALLRLEGKTLRAFDRDETPLFVCRAPVNPNAYRFSVGGRLAAMACGTALAVLKLSDESPHVPSERARLLEPKT